MPWIAWITVRKRNKVEKNTLSGQIDKDIYERKKLEKKSILVWISENNE